MYLSCYAHSNAHKPPKTQKIVNMNVDISKLSIHMNADISKTIKYRELGFQI